MSDAITHARENNIQEQLFIGGLYKHYKGNLYVVVALPDHHDDLLAIAEVIYVPLNDPKKSYRRPVKGIDGFLTKVEIESVPNYKVPRFRLVGTATVTITSQGVGILTGGNH